MAMAHMLFDGTLLCEGSRIGPILTYGSTRDDPFTDKLQEITLCSFGAILIFCGPAYLLLDTWKRFKVNFPFFFFYF